MLGAPPWLDDLYDINAKIPDADTADWQKQGNTLDKKLMLQQMLQGMLADLFHLVVHHVSGAVLSGYSLETGKSGARLMETKPGEVLPEGLPLDACGVFVPWRRGENPRTQFYGATMAEFARHLSHGSRPVQDHTRLMSRYDFSLNRVDDPDSKNPSGFVSFDDPDPLSHWDFNSLGLRLRIIKVPVDTLVIEHVERPSEN